LYHEQKAYIRAKDNMKVLKWFVIGILLTAILIFAGIKFFSEEKPTSNPGKEADELAQLVMSTLNKTAFDTIPYLKWSFAGRRDYFWDKKANRAVVSWGENRVLLNLDEISGNVYKDDMKVEGDSKTELIEKAWSYWCNDSFWMIAPFKLMDPGTVRSIVQENGEKGLLVEYTSGGVTPGDSYLWILNEQNIPTGYKMWTSILPVKGAYSSWENWQSFDGAMLSTMHKLSKVNLEMKDVQSGSSYTDFGFESDPFEPMNN
jgi:hypothetical protein